MALTKVTSGLISADASSVDLNIDAGTLYIDSTNNNVGIGTSSPSSAISASSTVLEISDSNVATLSLENTTQSTKFELASLDVSGGAFTIRDNNNERLRIDSSGNVGLSTSSPSTRLTVKSSSANGIELDIDGAASSNSGRLFFTTSGGSNCIRSQSGNLVFTTGATAGSNSGTEAMRINTSGHLLVGCTAYTGNTTNTGGGIYVDGSGSILFSSANGSSGIFNRVSTDGNIVEYRKNGGTVGSISCSSGNTSYNSNGGIIYIGGNQSNHIQVITSTASGTPRLQPSADNTVDLGTASTRFDDVFATNGTIQTSDRNEKQDEADLSDAETRVAVAAKGLLKKFRWKSAVEEKGDEARVHFGIIAQDLQDAFTAEGLDASDYAMFINSEWWESYTDVPAIEAQEAVLDEDGNVVTEAVEAKEAYTRTDTYETEAEAPEGAIKKQRMGVRYSELLAFIIAGI